jgi:membrane-bound lytic murein transglycosylase A
LAPEARPNARRLAGLAFGVIALACSLAPVDALAARHARSQKPSRPPAVRHLPYPELESPFQINGGQYAPVAWSEIAGWREDDHLAAYKAFRVSCRPISAQRTPPADPKALGTSLRDPCPVARGLELSDGLKAKAFFEEHFLPLRISRLGEGEGFVTGYYEPIVDGSRTENEVYKVPVYRRPSNLFVRGTTQSSAGLPNKGQVFRKIGRRKLVPYYDRGEIEDGVIAGRGLEICYLKEQTDLLFSQIQGSARVSLDGGSTVRINYDAHNGYPYTAVGRILIEQERLKQQKNNPNKYIEVKI